MGGFLKITKVPKPKNLVKVGKSYVFILTRNGLGDSFKKTHLVILHPTYMLPQVKVRDRFTGISVFSEGPFSNEETSPESCCHLFTFFIATVPG
jgi:hypothetical protein